MEETDEELLARHKYVSELVSHRTEKLKKMKFGCNRDMAARTLGCLGFQLLQIKSKMEERGLDKKIYNYCWSY